MASKKTTPAGQLSIEFAPVRAAQRERLRASPKAFDLLAAGSRTNHSLGAGPLRAGVGYGHGVASRTLDAHIDELRRKLEADPTCVAFDSMLLERAALLGLRRHRQTRCARRVRRLERY
jgi:DNA-binding response OmpR family regulator